MTNEEEQKQPVLPSVIVAAEDDDASPCPSCGRWVPGQHELGVMRDPKPQGCGWCSHASTSRDPRAGGGFDPWSFCGLCNEAIGEDGKVIPKKFFEVDDGSGVDYTIVARDVEHAKEILRSHGVEFTKEDGYSASIDHPEFASLEWRELLLEQAEVKMTIEDGGNQPYRAPLSQRRLGDFYCSEW